MDFLFLSQCLFPDAYEKASQSSSPPYTSPSTSHKMAASSKQNILVGKLKSAPVDSLTFLLANSLCILNNEYGMFCSKFYSPGHN